MLVEVTGSIASRLQYCLVSDCKWIINKNQIQSKEDRYAGHLVLANNPVEGRQPLGLRSKMDNTVVALAFLHSHNLVTKKCVYSPELIQRSRFKKAFP